MNKPKRKWDTESLDRFTWLIVDTHSPDEPLEPFDLWQHIEDLCASVPDEPEDSPLTLHETSPQTGNTK